MIIGALPQKAEEPQKQYRKTSSELGHKKNNTVKQSIEGRGIKRTVTLLEERGKR